MRVAAHVVAVAALALIAAPPAQADEPSPARVDALMTQAYDAMRFGARSIERSERLAGQGRDEQAAAERAQAAEAFSLADGLYGQVVAALDGLEQVEAERRAAVERVAHYNRACARARLGRTDDALTSLSAALDAGYDDLARVGRDPDLESVRGEARFENLVTRARARLRAAAADQAGVALSDDALFPYGFDVTTLDGERLRLEDLAGKVVIVDYWGTWCGPCRAELPHFARLAQEYGDRLAIVGMTWERGQSGPEVVARVRAFAAELGVAYPLVLVTDDAELARVPQLDAFPTTLFLDRQGRVRAREVGYRDLESLRAGVEALLAEPEPRSGD